MPSPEKEVLIVGFGAVGAIYSLILKKSGLARITVVARSNYDAVKNDGVHFQSQKYGHIKGWRPDRLCRSVADAADQPYSYVILTTKAVPELTSTSKILAPLFSAPYADTYPQPTYILLQNGLNVEIDLYNALKALGKGDPKIISTALHIGTNLIAPNVVEHNDFDNVFIGVYRHKDFTTTINTPEETSLLEDAGKMLETGGTVLTIVPEIQRHKFSKNLWNVSYSSFTALTRYACPALFRPPPTNPSQTYAPYVSPTTAELIETCTIPTMKAVLHELIVLARALGFPDSTAGIPSSYIDVVIESARAMHVRPDSTHKPSMLLDVEKDQPIEVEVILGEVVRMAKERNVEMPRVEMLYALLLVMQNQILRKMEASSLTK